MTQKEPAPFQFAQAGQPGNAGAEAAKEQPAATQPANGSEQQPNYVTRQQLDAALDEIKRLTQSMTDKASSRIEKQMAQLQKAGIQATPEQVQKLVQAAEAETQEQPQPQPSQRRPASPAQQEEADDPVTAMAKNILKRAGIDPASITQDDPDFGLINPNAATEEEYLASIRAYATAKTARKGSPARMPGMAPAGGAASGSKAALLAEYNRLRDESPSKNARRLNEIATELKKLERK